MADEAVMDEHGSQLDQQVNNSYTNYTNSVSQTVERMKDLKSNLKQMQQSKENSNAETMAAEVSAKGEVLSIADALQAIDEEDAANLQYHQKASEYMAATTQAFAETVANGVGMFTGMADDFLKGGIDAIKDSDTLKKVGIATAAGVGFSILPGGELAKSVTESLAGKLKLDNETELDEGVEEKHIEGTETPEEYINTMGEEAGGEGGNYDKDTVGETTTEEKELQSKENYVPPSENEATTISSNELNEMSNLDGYLDRMAKVMEQSDSPIGQLFAKGVAVLETTDFGQKIEETMERTGAAGKLFAQRDEMDAAEKQNQNNGPEYPGA